MINVFPANPATKTPAVRGNVADILRPLIIVTGDDTHVEKTWGKLMEAGDVLEQVELGACDIFFHFFS
jgi:hypothetical protein